MIYPTPKTINITPRTQILYRYDPIFPPHPTTRQTPIYIAWFNVVYSDNNNDRYRAGIVI